MSKVKLVTINLRFQPAQIAALNAGYDAFLTTAGLTISREQWMRNAVLRAAREGERGLSPEAATRRATEPELPFAMGLVADDDGPPPAAPAVPAALGRKQPRKRLTALLAPMPKKKATKPVSKAVKPAMKRKAVKRV